MTLNNLLKVKDLLTIITITKNNDYELINTLNSISNQELLPYEVIVKDGNKREKPEFLKEFSFQIKYISEEDKGIYDAMNHCISLTKTTFLLFLNSGDILEKNSLNFFLEEVTQFHNKNSRLPEIIFFKWRYYNNKKVFSPSLSRLRFNHQSVIYKSSLHNKFGNYISLRSFSAADYLFFRYITLSDNLEIILSDKIISLVDENGISSSLKTLLTVISIDYIFGVSSRLFLASVAILHPFYHKIKKIIKKFL